MRHSILTHKALTCFIVAILSVGTLIACDGTSSPANDEQVASQIKNAIPDDIGRITTSSNGNALPKVIIVEENHASRAGQIEIAIMLNRLYHRHGVRHLGLEGAVLENPAPQADWFHQLPEAAVRQEVALQLLEQGEVSAADFTAMIFPDFQLHPIETESEYMVELSNDISGTFNIYMFSIAQELMNDNQLREANRLCGQEDKTECIDFIMDSNPWTKSRNDYLDNYGWSIEGLINMVDELKEKAAEVDADLADNAPALQGEREFYIAASKRSDTMVTNSVPILNEHPEAAILLDIGSAHTEKVVKLLESQGISFAVISPQSLIQSARNGDLYSFAYDRKIDKTPKSVDSSGALGAFLDGRKKPRSVLNEPWFRLKAVIMYATTIIARAAAGGDPPFNLDDDVFDLDDGEIDPSSIEVVNGYVTFALDLPDKRLWIRAQQVEPERAMLADEVTLEEALREILEDVRSEEPINSRDEASIIENQHSADNPASIQVSRDVIMQVSTKPFV